MRPSDFRHTIVTWLSMDDSLAFGSLLSPALASFLRQEAREFAWHLFVTLSPSTSDLRLPTSVFRPRLPPSDLRRWANTPVASPTTRADPVGMILPGGNRSRINLSTGLP